MSQENSYLDNIENIKERKFYKSFQTNKEIPMEKIISTDKEELWKSLDPEKARDLIKNRKEYQLNDSQVKALAIYNVIKYSSEYLADFEVMYIAELMVYEINQLKLDNNVTIDNSSILEKLIDISKDQTKSKRYRLGAIELIKAIIEEDID